MIITDEEYEKYPFIKPRDGWYGATEIPQGWHDIVMIMCEEIAHFFSVYRLPIEKYHLDQGKEKFGELCWYDSFDEDVENAWFIKTYIQTNIIEHYKHILRYICANCGKPAIMRRKSWIEPLCNNCYQPDETKNDIK